MGGVADIVIGSPTSLSAFGQKYWINDPTYATAGPVGVGNTLADTTALNNAADAAIAAGSGVVQIPAGTFQISSWPHFTTSGGLLPFAIRGMSSQLTTLKSYATSLATSLTITAQAALANGSGGWGGFTIDGTNATGTAVGISWSDVSQVLFEDMLITNFTGASQVAMYFYNQLGFSERVTMNSVILSNNTTAMDFAVGTGGYASFDYWNVLSLSLTINANQNGIVDEIGLGTLGGAGQIQHVGCNWNMVVNANTGATNTGILFYFKGDSLWYHCGFVIRGETDGGSVGHVSFNMAGNASACFQGFGTFFLSGSWQAPVLNFAQQLQNQLSGIVSVPNSTYLSTSPQTVSISTQGFARQVGTGPGSITLTSGTAYQNTSGVDLWLIISINSTAAAATAKMLKQFFSISTAPTNLVWAAAAAGETSSISVILQANNYIRIDLVNATFGPITTEPV